MAEKRIGNKYDINTVLMRIFQQNPQIPPSRIELFSEVYYPIAILEMELSETTFEDFDVVPFSVLKFVSAGLGTSEEIAELMGVSCSYIQKIMNLLMGYGHIDANGITYMGKESLEAGKKVTHAVVRQRFQADAVTGDLLKIGEQPFEADLLGRKHTYGMIPLMPHMEGISVEEINQQLQESDLTRYKNYQGDILHANADDIKDVNCIGLKYIKAYLVKMQGIDIPFIFSYRYDSGKREFHERFRWQPMRMPCEKAYSEYGFSRDIKCYPDEALEMINSLYGLVCKNIAGINEEKIRQILNHIQPFDYETMDISLGSVRDGVPEQISVYVNAASFTKWNSFVLTFLEQYDPDSGYLYTNSWLNGLFIRFESQNPDIRKASKMYQKLLRHENRKQLNTYIKGKLFSGESVDVAIDLKEFMEVLEAFALENQEEDQEG